LRGYAKSDTGRVRECNEDSFLCKPPLFVVADGMGGHVAGEIASKTATEVINDYVMQHARTEEPAILLAAAINEANREVYRLSRENSQYAGMGTTVTTAYVEGNKIYWSHIGDSRIYLIRDDDILQVTPDHSLVSELVRSGNITAEEALTHPQRNILTRAVGTGESVMPANGNFVWQEDDILLLCTDGLTNMVKETDILDLVRTKRPDAAWIVDNLVKMANYAGGVDNITVLLAQSADGNHG